MAIRYKLVLAVFMELIYIACSHYLTANFDNFTPDYEHRKTLLRAITFATYYYLFQDYIKSFTPTYSHINSAYIYIAVTLFFATPLLVGNLYFLGDYTRILYAVSSIVVALKEELVFRVLIQNSLESKTGPIYAILFTSIIFTAWHYGGVPNTSFAFGQVLINSIFLGLIYSVTKSFLLVVFLHTTYDALWSLTPFYANIVNINWGFIPLSAAMLITAYWYFRLKNANK